MGVHLKRRDDPEARVWYGVDGVLARPTLFSGAHLPNANIVYEWAPLTPTCHLCGTLHALGKPAGAVIFV